MEIFKPIPNYEGIYEISNKCRVKALPKEVLRDNCGLIKYNESFKKINKSNQVCLFKEKKRKWFCVKKLYFLVFENKEILNSKFESLTFDGIRPILTTQRKIVAHAKKYQETKKCKLTGVSLNTSVGKKYQASITIDKRNVYLGYFETEKEANLMYQKAEKYMYLYKGHSKTFRNMLSEVVL
jgi:hypothetical protein